MIKTERKSSEDGEKILEEKSKNQRAKRGGEEKRLIEILPFNQSPSETPKAMTPKSIQKVRSSIKELINAEEIVTAMEKRSEEEEIKEIKKPDTPKFMKWKEPEGMRKG